MASFAIVAVILLWKLMYIHLSRTQGVAWSRRRVLREQRARRRELIARRERMVRRKMIVRRERMFARELHRQRWQGLAVDCIIICLFLYSFKFSNDGSTIRYAIMQHLTIGISSSSPVYPSDASVDVARKCIHQQLSVLMNSTHTD